MSEYDVIESCNKCGAHSNDIKVTATVEGHAAEAETECRDCGHTDYWAYGHFESGAEMIGRCEHYYN